MSLEAEIHSQWATKSTLAGLLSAEKLFTGRAPPETPLPYATLAFVGAQPLLRASGGETVVDALLRFTIRAEHFADAASIAATLTSSADGFVGGAFSFAEGEVLDVSQQGERRDSTVDGVWSFDVDLRFRVHRSGA